MDFLDDSLPSLEPSEFDVGLIPLGDTLDDFFKEPPKDANVKAEDIKVSDKKFDEDGFEIAKELNLKDVKEMFLTPEEVVMREKTRCVIAVNTKSNKLGRMSPEKKRVIEQYTSSTTYVQGVDSDEIWTRKLENINKRARH